MMETNEDSTINVVFSIIVGDRREADMTLCCLCCCMYIPNVLGS